MVSNNNLARTAWRHFEPVHAIVYFAPEAPQRYTAVGLRGYWMGYFASRSAPMGEVGAEVVTAVFHIFAPTMVHRAIPDAWRFAKRDAVIAARFGVVDEALRRLWAERVESAEVREAAALAAAAASGLPGDGRPLFAAHAGLSQPESPHLALWHACTLLREHRFSSHVAALVGYGITGLEALVLHVAEGIGLDAASIRRFRGWTEEEWRQADSHLRSRGLVGGEGRLTDTGRSLRGAVERVTDSIASEPWERLGSERSNRLFSILFDLVERLKEPGGMMYPNPIGVEPPDAA